MKDVITINGKNLISVRRAAELTKYSKDYVGQLCREGKVAAQMIGRSWFIDEASILDYKKEADAEFEVRIKSYSEQRKSELSSVSRASDEVVGSTSHTSSRSIDSQSRVAELSFVPGSVLNSSEPVQKQFGSLAAAITLSYEPDNRPLLPELNKSFSSESVARTTSAVRKRAVASVLHITPRSAMAEKVAEDESDAEEGFRPARSSKKTMVMAMIAIAAVTAFGVHVYRIGVPTASVAIVDAQVATSNAVAGALEAVKDFIRGIFSKRSDTLAVADLDRSPPAQGIAVIPSTYSRVQDELFKEQIRRSFSDEVEIEPDESGTAGVVIPVFRDRKKGDSFMYVLVPVDEQRRE